MTTSQPITRVVLVDDHQLLLELLADAWVQSSDSTIAADVAEAVRLARVERRAVVLDITYEIEWVDVEPEPVTPAEDGPTYTAPELSVSPTLQWPPELDRNAGTSTPTLVIAALGKGNRILGADIARYQHPVSQLFPDGAPIDFRKMFDGGVRFLYIKASDGRDPGHNNAERWYAADRRDAR